MRFERVKLIKKLCLGALAVSALASIPASAEAYSDHALAGEFIDEMVREHGFDKGKLQQLFATAERKQSILDAMARPAEKTLTWGEYRKLFVHDKNINHGRQFLQEYRDTFDRAEAQYGVPREIIAAIIGVETRWGRIMGSFRVLDALSTLAFDYPRRAKFFRQELEHFLILTRDQGTDPGSHKGSYAGAMGYGQFMPSSYRSYAVDFDRDGLADIWKNPVDAIGSVANYLHRHGWKVDQLVTARADLGAKVDESVINGPLKPAHSVAELSERGFSPRKAVDGEQPATAVKLVGENGEEYWLGLNNFYVITRYNRSRLYAMAVYQLSRKLRS